MEYHSPTGQLPVGAGAGARAAPITTSQVTVALEVKTIRVLVAMDESEGSFYALRWALDNLFSGCAAAAVRRSITLLHVVQPIQHSVYPSGPGTITSKPMLETVKKAQQEYSAKLLARALEICRGRPVNVETMIMEGDPKDMICEAVDKVHYDFLIVGSRGLGKIKRAFLGSVSDYCAHHANCPILIVKPPK